MNGQQESLTAKQAGVLQVRVQVLRDTLGTAIDDPLTRIRSRVASYLECLTLPQESATADEHRWAEGRRGMCLEDLQAQLGHQPTVEDLEAHMSSMSPLGVELRSFIQRDLDRGVEE